MEAMSYYVKIKPQLPVNKMNYNFVIMQLPRMTTRGSQHYSV